MSTLVLPDEIAISAKERAQWMLHRLVPGRGICNVGLAMRVDQQLRWWPLQQALNHLIRRHPALRTKLQVDGAVPRKRFLDSGVGFPLTTEAATEEDLPEVLSDLVARPFALDGEPLARAHLVLLPSASVVCVVCHHLVADHASATVLLGELSRLYDGFAQGRGAPPELADVAPFYSESSPDRAAVDFWVHHLAGVEPADMALAGARPIAGRPTFEGSWLKRRMSREAFAAVGRIQQRTRLTQNMVLLAAFYLLLARHGAGPDLVVGVPVDRSRGAGAEVVGFHANTLPVRVRMDDAVGVVELLDRTCRALLSGMEHAVSFEEVQDALAVRSGDWRVPLFRHIFNYRPSGGDPLSMAGESFDIIEVHHPASRVDLEWIAYGSPTALDLTAVYSTEVHDRGFVQTLLERYDAAVVELAGALDQQVTAVSVRTPADELALRRLNATERRFPDRSLLEEVRARAVDHPDAPAVRAAGGTLTYAGLLAAAEAVRRTLVGEGVRPGEPVALCSARRPELAAAVLGVWAAGGAYLPLDPSHPARRLATQLDDAGARVVLADGAPDPSCRAGRRWLALDTVCGADGGSSGEPGQASEQWPAPRPTAPAYVIYTSGSTGSPNGVEVSHASLANLVRDFAVRLSAGPHDRTLWLTTFSFDISTLELLLPLVTGGTVVIASDEDRVEPRRLLDLVVAEAVTVLQATPTTWRQVAGQLQGELRGRRVLSGGEPLGEPLARQLLASGCRLFNVYGPTETTIWSTVAELSAPVGEPVPIGAPIANTTAHVLDSRGRPVLPGMPGELCIAGAGVAIGYRGRPELTAERFRQAADIGRYYRTGDQVRLDASGLVFLGRRDRQVKIRGHRVELTEVEAVLESHPQVRAAAVVTEPDGTGYWRLVAALQPEGEQEPAAEGLRALVAGRLPEAAVPSRYVCLPELPVTGNGKIDHRALGERLARSSGPAQLPADPVLGRLTALWRDVLGDDRLGADANFFLSGGHSLLAVELADRIAEAFDVDVGFDAVFDAPSPERFVAWLAARDPRGGEPA